MPSERVVRWFANFASRHGAVAFEVRDGGLHARAEDGSTAQGRLPFDGRYGGSATPDAFAAAVDAPPAWGLLLVRKGGFAVARLERASVVASKVGQRHVQGRTKAGGQSQQRFARRRDNQAQAAYDAAADHAARILAGDLDALVTGGDRSAVDAVLDDPRLARPSARRTSRWLPVPDPRRSVLVDACRDARAVEIRVVNS